MTVHISESDLSKPVQLDFRTNELIGRVFLFLRSSKCLQKTPVEFNGCGCNMLEIAEDATGAQGSMDLGIERCLANVGEVVQRG